MVTLARIREEACLKQMQIPLFPEVASSTAEGVDDLYYYLSAVTVVMTAPIFAPVFIFALKYRRRSEDEIPPPHPRLLET